MDFNNDAFDDESIDVTKEANFIWSIADRLRKAYMPDHYGDVIIPMTILRRFECTLAPTKDKVVSTAESAPDDFPEKALCKIAGYPFYNTSRYTLAELCNDPDNLSENFLFYISRFSQNVISILENLEINKHIDQMNRKNCLFPVVQAFSELNLSPDTIDSIKMGYIFENIIGRFYQNVSAGQFYTGRDIIKTLVSVLIASEECNDMFDNGKVITVGDQACGTGGMLSTAYSYLSRLNPSADIRLFGQEVMPTSYAMGLAEMLIKGQDAENFVMDDTLVHDRFPNIKMRFMIMNPPFGQPWSGDKVDKTISEAVKEEHAKGLSGRWGAGLPDAGDSQLLFMQSAINKMDDDHGRAAIISDGSPLYSSKVAGGDSQIRRWMIENDLIEAIIAMPTDLFYNTGIATYAWILSKNKTSDRKGKIQLIDATEISHKLRKPLGDKKVEFTKEDRAEITRLYSEYDKISDERVKIIDNKDFLYREYTVMQPLQRSYGFTEDRIENLISKGSLNTLYNPVKVAQLESSDEELKDKDAKQLAKFKENEPLYQRILDTLKSAISDEKWMSPDEFIPELGKVLESLNLDKKTLEKIADGLSVMDKEAVIQRDKKDNIIYDKDSKDTEIVKFDEDIEEYMKTEVLPFVPDAKWFFEEDLSKKSPVIKTGAGIPFNRYFYQYKKLEDSDELKKQFEELEAKVDSQIPELFKM